MRLARYRKYSRSSVEPTAESGLTSVVLFLLLHVGLALLFREERLFSTIHALLVLVFGLYKAITAQDLAEVVPYAAYIMGAEVLWRMTKADVFWEYGKYAMVLLLTVALLKQRKPLKNFVWPLFSFLLLLPSIFLTVDAHGFSERSRELISFNLSGPLAVFVCLVFFSQVTLDQQGLKRAVWAAVYPIVSILTIALISTLTSTAIYFGSESVFETSGGFGPNQVSAALGLGALLLILYAIQPRIKGRTLAVFLSLLLILQSFLTFSRGGIYNLVIALGVAFIFLMRKPSKIVKPFLIVFLIILIVGFVFFPRLEELTEGALSTRFTDLNPVSRIEIANQDVDLFLANPIAGVGPGMSSTSRPGLTVVAAHTEYSRILAEHGLLGAISLLILIWMLFRALFKTRSAMAQALLTATAGWAAVEMAHSAMRIASIPFMLGFAMVTFNLEAILPEGEKNSPSRNLRFNRFQKRKNVG
jgi:O-antigen ligase